MTIFIGLTGGIGAGKSTALGVFERAGSATISTDEIVHDLLAQSDIQRALTERWGEGVTATGQIDRSKVAEIVFNDANELAWLEGVLFPKVGEAMARWREKLKETRPTPKLAVCEAPLLFEAGIEGLFDVTLSIVAEEGLCKQRIGSKGVKAVEGRIERQIGQMEKAKRSDYVIGNNGTFEELEAFIQDIIGEMERKFGQKVT